MDKTITVKGIGSVSKKPDLIVVTLNLESEAPDYAETMKLAAGDVDALQKTLIDIDFDKDQLKTMNFNVTTRYESYQDENNAFKNRFLGYVCNQSLKLEFDYDTDLLARALDSLAKSPVNPQFSIAFSIKDKAALSEELLASATKNAAQCADMLARASNKRRGELLSIAYNWNELAPLSRTEFSVDQNRAKLADFSFAPNINPEDIKVSDSATFVWALD